MLDWHYPRPALASEHLEKLFDQGVSRLAFFGRRRIGKTEYLRQDLIPAAMAKGVLAAVYCSFWENKDRPHLAFLRALTDAFPEGGYKAKVKAGLTFGVVNIDGELERADKPKAAMPDEISAVTQAFNAWVKSLGGRPGLILLDEVQHLATSAHFATFAASLRTMLDMAPKNIAVVFTGSSLADLQRLFADVKAPFFNFASVIDFPTLGRPFIDHLASIHKAITSLTCSADALWGIFQRTGANAHQATGLVERMVLEKNDDVLAAWAQVETDLFGEGGWCESLWSSLALSDQAVYLLLKEGQELFAESSLAVYEQLGFSRGTAQQALRRLVNKSLLHRQRHGNYERIVPLLDEWLEQRGLGVAKLRQAWRLVVPRGLSRQEKGPHGH